MKITNKTNGEDMQWLAQLIGTPENLKKFINILFPTLTTDTLWDNDKVATTVVDAENIENWEKLPMEYLGSRYVANKIVKNLVLSLANDLQDIINPEKEKAKEKKLTYK